MGILTMYRRVPRDTPANIRITARTLNLHRINTTEIDALCRIRWWQSWGFDPFEPTDEDEFYNRRMGNPHVEIDLPTEMTWDEWNRMVEEALRVGEPGFMTMPLGTIRAAGEVIRNEWPPSSVVGLEAAFDSPNIYARPPQGRDNGSWGTHPNHAEAIQQAMSVIQAQFPEPITVRDGEELRVTWTIDVDGNSTLDGQIVSVLWQGSQAFNLIEDM